MGRWCGLLGLVLLAWGSTGWRAHLHRADVLPAPWEGVSVVVQGRIDDLPQATPHGWRVRLAVTQAHALDSSTTTTAPSVTALPVPQRVLLHWAIPADAHAPTPHAGEVWRLAVRLRQPHGLHNPGGSDPELWFWEQGIGATGSVRLSRHEPAPTRLAAASVWDVAVWRERVRQRLYDTVPDARVAGVLAALVVGDQTAIAPADWGVFRATGVAHLMSISGLHITLWAWLTTALVGRAWRLAPRWAPHAGARLLLACPAPVAAGWGGWVLATAYAVFAGWGVPAQRTVLMLGLAVVLRLSGRVWPWYTLAAAAMAVVLAWDPWAWMQPGFWLSFVAVGVLMGTTSTSSSSTSTSTSTSTSLPAAPAPQRPHWTRHWAHHWIRHGALKLWPPTHALLQEQSRMSLALAPLSLWCFGQVSVVGFAANLLAVPWVTLVVTPLALAGCLWSPLWTGAAEALSGLHTLLQWAAARPWALWSLPQAPWPLALAATVGGVVLVLRVPWMWRGVGLVLMGPALLWTPQRPLAGEFELIAADVGQGSGVLIRTANTSVLYDSGPLWSAENDAGQRVLVPLLRALGASPSTLVLSHSDSDHVGGAAAVLAALPPTTQVRASFAPGALPSLKHHTSAHWTRCEAGQQWVEDGVRFEVLHPSAALYEGEAQTLKPLSTNDLSCVLWVQGRHASALLTGDMGTRFEAELVRHHPELRATVLMAPHHGSHTSSSEALLNTVRPALIVVQAGHRNRYGHPAAQVTARYDRLGLPWTATPTCGALRWDSLTQTPTCHRDTHRRHWHWQAD